MSSTDTFGFSAHTRADEPKEATNPPRRRKTPPLFIHDILTTERGVPTLLAHWFAARDMQRWEDE